MSYSALLVNNTTSSAVVAGGIVPLGSAIHGFGKAIKLNGNAINLTDTGYYRVIASCAGTSAGTAAISLALNVDGAAVPGAVSTAEQSAVAEEMNLVWLVRKACCCDVTALTFTLSAAATVTNVIVEIEKI